MRPLGSPSKRPTGHANKGVEAVVYYLDDWLDALTDSTHVHRMPDPFYVSPRGKTWTEDDLNRIILVLDAEINKEATGTVGKEVGAHLGPDYYRLAAPQRLALVQGLDALLSRYAPSLALLEQSGTTILGAVQHPQNTAWNRNISCTLALVDTADDGSGGMLSLTTHSDNYVPEEFRDVTVSASTVAEAKALLISTLAALWEKMSPWPIPESSTQE